jgi:hypothetical protein
MTIMGGKELWTWKSLFMISCVLKALSFSSMVKQKTVYDAHMFKSNDQIARTLPFEQTAAGFSVS